MMQVKILCESLLVGAVCFGSIVGAGFASGKEVWFYFAQFGAISFPLILLAGVLMFILGYTFLNFGKKHAINSVQNFNGILFGKFAIFSEIIFIFSNIILLASMFAGANSLFFTVLPNVSYRFASVLTAIIAIFISWQGFEKLVKINILIVPSIVLVIFIAFVYGVFNVGEFSIPVIMSKTNSLKALIFALLYVCGNLYFAGFIFARLGVNHSKKVNFWGAFIASLFLVVCLFGMVLSIYLNPYSNMSDMPLVYISNGINSWFGVLTLIIVWIGILTTAVSLIYTISIWFEKYLHSFKISSVLVCLMCLIISGIGFESIISIFYPILASVGVVFIVRMMYLNIKNNKKGKKYAKKY